MDGKEFLEMQKEKEAKRAEIRKRFPANWPNPVLEEIYYGRFGKQFVEGKKLILDAITGNQFDVVSDKYGVVHHEDVLDNLLEATPKEFGIPEVDLTFWKDGARFRATATFPDLKDFEIKKNDKVKPRVVFRNSYDRSTFLRLEFGAEQLVCSNGLVAYQTEDSTSQKHIGEINIKNLSDIIKDKVSNFAEQMGIWQKWTELPIQDDLVVIAKKMPFSAKEQEKLLALPLMGSEGKSLKGLGSQATLWDLNSAATQFAKHEIKGLQRSFDLERDIAKVVTAMAKDQ